MAKKLSECKGISLYMAFGLNYVEEEICIYGKRPCYLHEIYKKKVIVKFLFFYHEMLSTYYGTLSTLTESSCGFSPQHNIFTLRER